MKTLLLIWKFPGKYKLVVVIPGQFHTVINYMGVVTELRLCWDYFRGWSRHQRLFDVLNGKTYAKPLLCLKTVGGNEAGADGEV